MNLRVVCRACVEDVGFAKLANDVEMNADGWEFVSLLEIETGKIYCKICTANDWFEQPWLFLCI